MRSNDAPRLSDDVVPTDIIRRVNRQVAARFLPELGPLFDSLVAQGLSPKLVSLHFEGESRRYYDYLICDALSCSSFGTQPH